MALAHQQSSVLRSSRHGMGSPTRFASRTRTPHLDTAAVHSESNNLEPALDRAIFHAERVKHMAPALDIPTRDLEPNYSTWTFT